MTKKGHLDRARSKSSTLLDREILLWESGCICTASKTALSFPAFARPLGGSSFCLHLHGLRRPGDLYLCICMASNYPERISFSLCKITEATLLATCTVLSTEIPLCVETELQTKITPLCLQLALLFQLNYSLRPIIYDHFLKLYIVGRREYYSGVRWQNRNKGNAQARAGRCPQRNIYPE